MKPCALLLLLGTFINGADMTIHTLRYFNTWSSQVPNFPEYVSVGYVNDLQISHYDSRTKKYVPKQEWMNKITEEDPQYWDRGTQINLGGEQVGKGNIDNVKRRLNVTGGMHIYQFMYGCEWDDETNDIRGYYNYAFDGEDFISYDWETQTFVAPKQQAFVTKQTWERIGEAVRYKNYIIYECAEYLKKHVRNGESVLKRTVLPVVSLLQKTSMSPVTCHATGFFPEGAMLFWTKDGDELEDTGEILPNGDGTFQSSVSLDLSSVPPEDWDKFNCVFQLSGVKKDLITKLERHKIRTNEKKPIDVVSVVVPVAITVALAVVAVVLYRRWKAKQPSPPPSEPELMVELNPPAPQTQDNLRLDKEPSVLE